MSHWDVVVVGAGPGGCVAAREIASQGASVLLVDRQRFPRWKVCGACIGPAAHQVLRGAGLGKLTHRLGAVPVTHMTLAVGSRRARVALSDTRALSRATFDEALAAAAVEAGVDFRDGVRVTVERVDLDAAHLSLQSPEGRSEVAAHVIIDATGLGGRLRVGRHALEGSDVLAPGHEALRGEADRISPRSRIGIGTTIADSPMELGLGELRMVVGRTGYVGMVRIEDGSINVAAAIDPSALATTAPSEAVAELLHGAGLTPLPHAEVVWRGTPKLTRTPPTVAQPRLFRLGDAAGYVEPFTGEGMGSAMVSGLSVAPFAVEGAHRWDTELERAWTREHRRVVVRKQRLCRTLARGLRYPKLSQAAVAVVGRAPRIAAPFVRATTRVPSAGLGVCT